MYFEVAKYYISIFWGALKGEKYFLKIRRKVIDKPISSCYINKAVAQKGGAVYLEN